MPPTQAEEPGFDEACQEEEISSFQDSAYSALDDKQSPSPTKEQIMEEEEEGVEETEEPVYEAPIFLSPPLRPTVASKIFIDFRPVKYEPQTPVLSLSFLRSLDDSQLTPGDLRLEQGTQVCPSQQIPSTRPAKRRVFMKHGLSKKQRIREHLHQIGDK